MPLDYKKAFKELYQPSAKPRIIDVPSMNFVAVRGSGDPNIEGSEYKASIELLYGIAFTLKMSHKSGYSIKCYTDYVVPPLEGLWWTDGYELRIENKADLHFVSMIRLPDFVSKADFDWAVAEATVKKRKDFSRVEFLTYHEGLCVQCMHIGPYDSESATIAALHAFAREQGYALDYGEKRRHHEIYLSDPRRSAPEKLKTVIRLPIKHGQ